MSVELSEETVRLLGAPRYSHILKQLQRACQGKKCKERADAKRSTQSEVLELLRVVQDSEVLEGGHAQARDSKVQVKSSSRKRRMSSSEDDLDTSISDKRRRIASAKPKSAGSARKQPPSIATEHDSASSPASGQDTLTAGDSDSDSSVCTTITVDAPQIQQKAKGHRDGGKADHEKTKVTKRKMRKEKRKAKDIVRPVSDLSHSSGASSSSGDDPPTHR